MYLGLATVAGSFHAGAILPRIRGGGNAYHYYEVELARPDTLRGSLRRIEGLVD